MKEIQLTKGYVALIDDVDFGLISRVSWHYHKGYAAHTVNHRHRSPSLILMHRLILGAQDKQIIDHINGLGLDNRRKNLRFATIRQNQWNKRCTSACGYKGVHPLPGGRRFQALIRINGHLTHLGCFGSVEEAAQAYDVAAKEFFGEFARLNFPEAICS